MTGEIQKSFNAGMVSAFDTLPLDAFFYGKNLELRRGTARTRRGVRRAFPGEITRESFYFNQDDARYNDGTHTGFWFPWSWIGGVTIYTLQGAGWYRFAADDSIKMIIVSAGKIYKHENGMLQEVACSVTLATTEEIEFVQAGNYLFMLRGDDYPVLFWDGSIVGFVERTAADTGSDMPNARTGAFVGGRLWLVNGDHDIYASDIGDYFNWDYVGQGFSVQSGDGDRIQKLVPYHETALLVFKQRSIHNITPVNPYVEAGSSLVAYTSAQIVSSTVGLAGKNAIAIYGEMVAFLSFQGITTIERTQEGNIVGRERPLSWPIQDLIEKINWNKINTACAIWADNYLLFGVPTNNSASPNCILPFDLLANSGNGGWCGEWTGIAINPILFYSWNERTYFIGADGALRVMFNDDPWDSENIYGDVPVWDATKLYLVDDIIYFKSGGDKIYKCIQESINNHPTDTDYWEEVTDVESIHDINSVLITRNYDLSRPELSKLWDKMSVYFGHSDPKISITVLGEDHNTDAVIFTDVTYSQTKYEIADVADWVTSNVNLDHNNPHREDYAVYIPESTGLYIDESGLYLGVEENHELEFIPSLFPCRRVKLQVENKHGILEVKHINALGITQEVLSDAR